MHTLNLTLKNIYAAKNTANEITYEECNWITDVLGDAIILKKFIMNHSMRFAMFNEHVKMKVLSIAETRFASVIIMLKRFKTIKRGLQNLVLCEKLILYKDDDVGKAKIFKGKVLDDGGGTKLTTFFHPQSLFMTC